MFFRRQMTGAAINTNAALYEKLKSVMDGFNAPIRYAVAYGSGAYSQKGYDGQTIGKDTMVRIGHRFHVTSADPIAIQYLSIQVDFIFGVTHAQHWHSLNLRQNPSHYSSLASFGSDAVVWVQERMGARIYYNPDIVVNGVVWKCFLMEAASLMPSL